MHAYFIDARNHSLPCVQGRVRVGCERSEPREGGHLRKVFRYVLLVIKSDLPEFGCTPKPKQPHPNPPLHAGEGAGFRQTILCAPLSL
jgi:hypothetical protein